MWKAYKNEKLVASGTATDVAEIIGIPRRSLYELNQGVRFFLPKKAQCDMVEYQGLRYIKLKKKTRKKVVTNFELIVGSILNVKDQQFLCTNVEIRENDVIYTFNDDFRMRALKQFTNYNSAYIALVRRLENVSAISIPAESTKANNLVQNRTDK